jgi:Xaa-Pro aminopeptidase
MERGLKGRKIGLVGAIPYRQYLQIAGALGDEGLKDLSGPFRMMRTVRSKEEIDRLRFASELTDQSMAALAEGLREGMLESDLPALIEPVYLNAGGTAGIHFMTSMPMRNPHFPVPAQYPSKRRLAVGDCLITEISGSYWGYSGQIHRTFSLGEGPTPPWAEMHAVAVEAFETLADLIKDGTCTTEVEEASDLIHERGYSIYDDLLHGVSQYPPIIQTRKARRHEKPEIVFRENMVITIQPNVITHDEQMGLQFGETLLVGKSGCESLNAYPRKWITCGI